MKAIKIASLLSIIVFFGVGALASQQTVQDCQSTTGPVPMRIKIVLDSTQGYLAYLYPPQTNNGETTFPVAKSVVDNIQAKSIASGGTRYVAAMGLQLTVQNGSGTFSGMVTWPPFAVAGASLTCSGN